MCNGGYLSEKLIPYSEMESISVLQELVMDHQFFSFSQVLGGGGGGGGQGKCVNVINGKYFSEKWSIDLR